MVLCVESLVVSAGVTRPASGNFIKEASLTRDGADNNPIQPQLPAEAEEHVLDLPDLSKYCRLK